MADPQYERADNGSVLLAAMAAVMLIVAGLGLMALDDSSGTPAPASILQQH